MYERWADRPALLAFRGSGPSDELDALIEAAQVDEFQVVPASDG